MSGAVGPGGGLRQVPIEELRFMERLRFLLTFVLILAASCSNMPDLGVLPDPPETPLLTEAIPVPTTAVITEAAPEDVGPVTLRVWLPPQFDPALGDTASELLNARLLEFSSRRSDIRLDVRVKAVDGPGGLLDALTAASSAAPNAVPDLIALPHSLMEIAALKGLLYPFDGLSTLMESDDWYGYAKEMAVIQESTFGFPFAGDAPALLYRSSEFADTPSDFDSILNSTARLVFPASEPSSAFTLNLYMAAGGIVRDKEGRPVLDPIVFGNVLGVYQQGILNSVIPPENIQLDSMEQAYSEFLDGAANMTVIPVSVYLREKENLSEDALLAPLPTLDGVPYSLASGWVWALSTNHPRRQGLAVELAEYLMDPSFLSEWNLALDVLPTSLSAFATWENTPVREAAVKIAASARLSPSADLVSSISPAIRVAVLQVLARQGEPAALAEEAASKVR